MVLNLSLWALSVFTVIDSVIYASHKFHSQTKEMMHKGKVDGA